MPKSFKTVLILCTLLLLGKSGISGLPASAADGAPPSDRIEILDNKFVAIYCHARKGYLEDGGPVLIWTGDLTLVNGEQVEKFSYMPPPIDTLKTVDHITLAIFSALTKEPEAPRPEVLSELADFRQAVAAARSQIESAALSAQSIQRQRQIIDRSLAFIDRVLVNKASSQSELSSFVRDQLADVYENITEATALDLGALSAQVHKIKERLSPEAWKKLHVIVCGSHMARIEESHMQFFLRLLNEQQEGRRVVFYEGNASQQEALNLLGSHELDAQIGLAYFGDPDRMHRDLLSAAASKYLDQHPVK